MIADALIALFKGLLVGIGNAITAMFPPVPAWVTTHVDKVGTVTGYAYQADAWLPVSLAFTVAAAVLAAYVIGLTVGIVRVVASYLTLGGGAT